MTEENEVDLCLEIDCYAEASCYCTEHNEEVQKLRAAMQEFVDRVAKGHIRSSRGHTYKKFKELLGVS